MLVLIIALGVFLGLALFNIALDAYCAILDHGAGPCRKCGIIQGERRCFCYPYL
jgi:hypothetical protein